MKKNELSLLTATRIPNPSLPLVWVDGTEIGLRHDSATLRFFSLLPEGAYEAARLQISRHQIRGLIDLLTRTTDYYPTRPDGEPMVPVLPPP